MPEALFFLVIETNETLKSRNSFFDQTRRSLTIHDLYEVRGNNDTTSLKPWQVYT
jgi:hypothetical protein